MESNVGKLNLEGRDEISAKIELNDPGSEIQHRLCTVEKRKGRRSNTFSSSVNFFISFFFFSMQNTQGSKSLVY